MSVVLNVEVLEHIDPGTDLIVPLANGGPVGLLDVIEANADRLERVKVHQMHALHDRRYLHGAFGDRLRHISCFLSDVTRPCFKAHDRLGCRTTSARCETSSWSAPRSAGARLGVAHRPSRLLQPRAERRLTARRIPVRPTRDPLGTFGPRRLDGARRA